MQSLIDEKTAHDKNFLRVMSDEQCISILQSLDKQPKRVSQLSSEFGIDAGTVYRKLKLLQKSGLLETSCKITKEGKKFFLYKSIVKNLAILFFDNKLEIRIVLDRNKHDSPSNLVKQE